MKQSIVAAVALLLVSAARCAPKDPVESRRNETEAEKERSPVTQKQNPQPPPQLTFPFPFFPFRPDASLTPAMPPFTFPFLFPSFGGSRPSILARSSDLPLETFFISETDGEEDELRKNPIPDKKKPKKKKQKKKKPKTPKPLVVYQKENQVALEGPPFQPGFAGQFANGNQGSYSGYYMVYLVEVRWNGSNETQTIIAGRPVLNPPPTESAQITDLTGSLITESPIKPLPGSTTQCLFQRSTTANLSEMGKPPGPTGKPDQEEIISEELETGEEYDEDDPKKKKKSKRRKNHQKPKIDPPVTHPTQMTFI